MGKGAVREPTIGEFLSEYENDFLVQIAPKTQSVFTKEQLCGAFCQIHGLCSQSFHQPSNMDYDYPLRASQFVRDISCLPKDIQLLAYCYIELLVKTADIITQFHGTTIKAMLLQYNVTGQLPKTAEEIYGPPH